MPNQNAREFTPELSKEYLSAGLGDIERYGRRRKGQAVARMGARGLLGQASYGSEIGEAISETGRERSRYIGDFNLKVAGLQREERLTGERREYEMTEAEKTRKFQERLANMGYTFRRGEREASQGYERVQAQQGAVTGAIGSTISRGLGAYAGRGG